MKDRETFGNPPKRLSEASILILGMYFSSDDWANKQLARLDRGTDPLFQALDYVYKHDFCDNITTTASIQRKFIALLWMSDITKFIVGPKLGMCIQSISDYVPASVGFEDSVELESVYPIGSIKNIKFYVDPMMSWTDCKVYNEDKVFMDAKDLHPTTEWMY